MELKTATSEERSEIEQCIEAARRISVTLRSLMNYARPGPLILSKVNLHRLVSDTLALLQHQPMLHGRVLENRVQPDLPSIRVDANQLSQVCINLLLNAAQATPEGGRITVSADRSLRNDAIDIRITDTGCGILPDVLPHVFEPFFSTKRGKGTGLGLSIRQAYVRSHNGEIPDRERATTRNDRYDHSSADAAGNPGSAGKPRQYGGNDSIAMSYSVLIVDDEPLTLCTVSRGLNGEGFEVFTAGSGEEGLKIFREEKHDLVLLDIVLSGIDGVEVLRQIRAESPARIVLMMSAYHMVDRAVEAMKLGAYDYLIKPFHLQTCLRLSNAPPKCWLCGCASATRWKLPKIPPFA